MTEPKNSANNATVNANSDYMDKRRALSVLKSECYNIHLPDFLDFKKMVEKEDTVLEGISISSLYYDWPEFYKLNHTISSAIAIFSECPIEGPELPALQVEYKEIFQKCRYTYP